MKTVPFSIRLDEDLQSLLAEGARRTRVTKRELLRRTLRLHLRELIEREAVQSNSRVTNVEPWPAGALRSAFRKTEKAWEQVEQAATLAQGRPTFED